MIAEIVLFALFVTLVVVGLAVALTRPPWLSRVTAWLGRWWPAIAAGALALGAGALAFLRLAARAPAPREPERHDAEAAARERELAEIAKALGDHQDATAVLEEFRAIKDPNARTKAIAAWQASRRRRGSWRPPTWAIAMIVVFVLLVLLTLAAGCGPRVAPPVYSLVPSPLPTELFADLPSPMVADDSCPVVGLLPGEPLPAELVLGGATRAPIAACRGIVVDEGELLAAGQCEADRTLAVRLLEIEREARLSDRTLCEDVSARRFQYGEDMRAEVRAKTWAGMATGAVAFAAGVGLGLAFGAVLP